MDDDSGLIADIRAFNRFYTPLIGALDAGHLETPYTLTEARTIYEIGRHGTVTHGELARALKLDPGYLSRLNQKLTDLGLVAIVPNPADRRSTSLALTRDGEAALATLNAATELLVGNLLAPLDHGQRAALRGAMRRIRALLGDALPAAPLLLRPHRIGELGWLVHRQGLLYNQQHGWNGAFEALIAKLYHDYAAAPDAPPKALWIAERNGAVAGSVFVMPSEGRPGTAQLRMLYVEPEARGLGIGRVLVDQTIRFARESAYRRVRLWTQSILIPARKIYAAAGFHLVDSAPHHSFGADLVGENWELEL